MYRSKLRYVKVLLELEIFPDTGMNLKYALHCIPLDRYSVLSSSVALSSNKK